MVFGTFNELVQELKNICLNKKIYIWGTGVYGDLFGQFLNHNNINWFGYYDNFTTDTVQILNGKEVIGGAKVTKDPEKIYILSMRNFSPVQAQLMEHGIQEKNIFSIGTIEAFNDLENSVIDNDKYSHEIKKFHNIHKGESCFVIGNGPSLAGKDLDTLYEHQIPCFACNDIYKAYDKTLWRPTYYVITDVNGIVMINDAIPYIAENCNYMFSRSNGRLREFTDNINNIRLFRSIFSESEEQFSFSKDCSEHLYMGHTVTYAMLQLAVYMGFQKIYLLGIDHQYATEYADGKKRTNNVKNYSSLLADENDVSGFYLIDKTTLAYRAARKYADAHGIEMYNATRGGKLEEFKRVDFDSLFCR